MTTTEIFAKRLKKLRNENRFSKTGISLKELASALDTTAQSLSLYEKAERTINIDMLVKISKYFNVSTDYLLGLTDNKTADTDLQSVCKYTGLNDEAVSTLNKKFANHDTNTEITEIANYFISSGGFYIIMSYLFFIKANSELWYRKLSCDYELEKENLAYSNEAKEYSKECDYQKVLINQLLAKYMLIYDKRYNIIENKKIIIDDIQAFEEFKNTLLWAEEYFNGEHNPSEE